MLRKIAFSTAAILVIGSLIISDGGRGGVAAIHCFQCNSHYDPECEVVLPNETYSRFYRPCDERESGGREMFCRKIVQTIHDRDGLVRVIRRCGWILHEKKDCYQVANAGHQEVICQCFHDACNAASPCQLISHVTLLISGIFAVVALRT